MLDAQRPVSGHDMEDLREMLGLSVGDFCWLFGLSMNGWADVKALGDSPLRDPAMALMARWLFAHPDDCPIPQSPAIEEVFAQLQSDIGVNKKQFGVALGREASAGYRWMVQGRHPPPILMRILMIWQEYARRESWYDLWQAWQQICHQEALSRQIENIWQSGKWQSANDN